jgi:hypothetical protein
VNALDKTADGTASWSQELEPPATLRITVRPHPGNASLGVDGCVRAGRDDKLNFLELPGVAPRGHGTQEAQTMGRTVTVQWVKGMKVEGAVGPHRLVMDAPAEAGGGDEAPSPAELLLGAIGA